MLRDERVLHGAAQFRQAASPLSFFRVFASGLLLLVAPVARSVPAHSHLPAAAAWAEKAALAGWLITVGRAALRAFAERAGSASRSAVSESPGAHTHRAMPDRRREAEPEPEPSGGATAEEVQVVMEAKGDEEHQPTPPHEEDAPHEEDVPPAPVADVEQPPTKKKETSLARSISKARPVIRTTGPAGKKGLPMLDCDCTELPQCELPTSVCCGFVGYILAAGMLILGAGAIARLTAMTNLYGNTLGFVSWLLCMLLFCLCAGVWFLFVKPREAASGCLGFWVFLGVVASILCILLSHIGDSIDFIEAAGSPVWNVVPEARSANADYLNQDNVREVNFGGLVHRSDFGHGGCGGNNERVRMWTVVLNERVGHHYLH